MGALDGIRIVEFDGLGPVPFAAMLLADMGAEIIRVVRPNATQVFATPITHRGRATVIADLKDLADLAQVKALVDSADAVIEGFRPGVLERLGLAPDDLIARNPKLIVGRMTGWGQHGPLAHTAGHDINYIAIAGALAAIGPAERPTPPLSLVGDFGGGALYLVSGVLAGLLSAARTGCGQVIDAAMCDGALSLMTMFFEMEHAGQWRHAREANMLDGGAPYYGVYACADGLHLAIGAIEPQFFEALCRGLGVEKAIFAARDDRAAWPALRETIAAIIAGRPRAEWLDRFASLDACVTAVVSFDQAADHPHIAARGGMIDVDGLLQPAPAPRFGGTPSAVRTDRETALTFAEIRARWTA